MFLVTRPHTISRGVWPPAANRSPSQAVPFHLNPSTQPHSKLPRVLVQVELAPHGVGLRLHSSMSVG
jgi:hypothetical protein